GTLLAGPAGGVARLLARLGTAAVAALDAVIAARSFWDRTAPISIREVATPRAETVYCSARVGLSLKRMDAKPEAPRFIGRPYRYLTEPRRIAKGRPHLVLALHQEGKD